MTRTDFNNSLLVASIGWAANVLEIEFADGRIFQYDPVAADPTADLLAADWLLEGFFKSLGSDGSLTVTEVTE